MSRLGSSSPVARETRAADFPPVAVVDLRPVLPTWGEAAP